MHCLLFMAFCLLNTFLLMTLCLHICGSLISAFQGYFFRLVIIEINLVLYVSAIKFCTFKCTEKFIKYYLSYITKISLRSRVTNLQTKTQNDVCSNCTYLNKKLSFSAYIVTNNKTFEVICYKVILENSLTTVSFNIH